jgi:hypothetical protein
MIANGMRAGTTLSMSASSRRMAGDFPPHSRVTRLNCYGRAARETDLVDQRVSHKRLTVEPVGRHDVQHTRGQIGLHRRLGEQVRVERGLGRGLKHDGAAGDQRRREVHHREDERRVPRHDLPYDAHRLPKDLRGPSEASSVLLKWEGRHKLAEVVEEHHRNRCLEVI